MSNVENIKQQIRELSSREFAELRDWVLEQDWQVWDTQIESDSRAGKLDKVLAEAQADYLAGRSCDCTTRPHHHSRSEPKL